VTDLGFELGLFHFKTWMPSHQDEVYCAIAMYSTALKSRAYLTSKAMSLGKDSIVHLSHRTNIILSSLSNGDRIVKSWKQ
jgi:hypothetical protein